MQAKLVTQRLIAMPEEKLDVQKSSAITSPSLEADLAQSEPPIKEPNFTGMPRRISVVAGVALVMTTGAVAKVASDVPEFEGKFQIAAQAIARPETAPATQNPTVQNQVSQGQVSQGQNPTQAIVAPGIISDTPISDTQIRILQSPKFIDPVVKQLQAQDPDFDYAELAKNLKIKATENQGLEVRYRDSDPERVRLVLNQLAQTYVDYSQECRDPNCKGIQFIETKLPEIQQKVTDLREQIRQFHEQHNLNNLDVQIRLFSRRATELTQQGAEVQGKLAEMQQRYAALQQRMTLKESEAIVPALLQQDARYQAVFLQLQEIDRQIANELSRLDANQETLKTLYANYQTTYAQLNQEAQQVLSRYVNNPNANVQDPVFQEPIYLQLLQESVNTAHYMQVLQTRQQTIATSEDLITQQRNQVATLLRQYGDLRQQLRAEAMTLQQHLDKLEALKVASPDQMLAWNLVAPPEMMEAQINKAQLLKNLQRDVSTGAVLGVLMGIGVAAVLEQHNQKNTRLRSLPA